MEGKPPPLLLPGVARHRRRYYELRRLCHVSK